MQKYGVLIKVRRSQALAENVGRSQTSVIILWPFSNQVVLFYTTKLFMRDLRANVKHLANGRPSLDVSISDRNTELILVGTLFFLIISSYLCH